MLNTRDEQFQLAEIFFPTSPRAHTARRETIGFGRLAVGAVDPMKCMLRNPALHLLTMDRKRTCSVLDGMSHCELLFSGALSLNIESVDVSKRENSAFATFGVNPMTSCLRSAHKTQAACDTPPEHAAWSTKSRAFHLQAFQHEPRRGAAAALSLHCFRSYTISMPACN